MFFVLVMIWLSAFIIFNFALPRIFADSLNRTTVQQLDFLYSFFGLRYFFLSFLTLIILTSIRLIANFCFAYIEIKPNKIESVWGLFRKKATVIPFHAVRTIKRYQYFSDRIVGTGRILVASSGTNYYEIHMRFLSMADINTISDHIEKKCSC